MAPWAAKFHWIVIINISLFVIMLYSKLYFNTIKAKDIKKGFGLLDYNSMFSANKTGKLPCINSIHLHLTNRSWKHIQPRSLHYHLENCLQASTIFTRSCSMTVFLIFTIVWEAAEEPVWKQENGVGGPLHAFQVRVWLSDIQHWATLPFHK